jgi:hypothetical protein
MTFCKGPLFFLLLLGCVEGGSVLLLPERPCAAGHRFPTRDLHAVLPETSKARLTIDGGPWIAAGDTLVFRRWLDDPARRASLAPWYDQLDAVMKELDPWVQPYTGLDTLDTLRLLRYRISLSFQGMVPGNGLHPLVPDLVLSMEFGPDAAPMRALVEALEVAVLAWGGGHFVDDVVSGVPTRRYVPKTTSAIDAWYTIQDHLLILATDRTTMEGCLRRLKSGSIVGSLAALRGREGEPTLVSLEVDGRALIPELQPFVDQAVIRSLSRLIGDRLEYSLLVADGRLEDRLRISPEGEIREAVCVPDPRMAGFVLSARPQVVWETLLETWSLWDAQGPRQLRLRLAAARWVLGWHPEKDFLGSLESGLVGWLDVEGDAWIGAVVVSTGAGRETQAGERLAALCRLVGGPPRPVVAQNRMVMVWDGDMKPANGSTQGTSDGTPGSTLAWSTLPGALVIGSSAEAVTRVLEQASRLGARPGSVAPPPWFTFHLNEGRLLDRLAPPASSTLASSLETETNGAAGVARWRDGALEIDVSSAPGLWGCVGLMALDAGLVAVLAGNAPTPPTGPVDPVEPRRRDR